MAQFDLKQAKDNKQDEFYTQLADIEIEMKHYRQHFKNKIILCNCDDPYESNFFKYFAMNFNFLGLKKLIATCYNGSPVAYTQLSIFDLDEDTPKEDRIAYKVEITKVEDLNGDGAIDLDDVEAMLQIPGMVQRLEGNGDFRSEECIELLKEADIVVTNPPFSLFREYIGQLEEYNKKYIIIGNVNAITYKEVFPLIRDNKLWMGASIHSGDREFRIPDSYEARSKSLRIDNKGYRYVRVVGVRWWTNLDYIQRHEDLILYKTYKGHEEEYPKFDNYDAINVSTTTDIPMDYEGMMGVPITFLDKYNPDQFEILGITQRNDDPYKIKKYSVDEYKNANDLNARATILVNGKPKSVYARILIRKKVQ